MKISLKELEGRSQEELVQIATQVMELKRARQFKKLEYYLKNAHEGQIAFHKSTHRIRYVFAGNRCMSRDSLIETIDGPRRISDIKEPTKYLSLLPSGDFDYQNGTAPFLKPAEAIYRVTHDYGEFEASLGHRVLSADGHFIAISEMVPGQTLIESPLVGASVVSSIELVHESAELWDVTVAGSHNYVSGGAVHENSGKSTAGAAEMIWCCLGIHPFKKGRVPIKTAIIVPDFENHAKGILEPKLKEWAPEGSIKKLERHQGGAVKKIYWSSGSTSEVFSHDQDHMVFEGSDYDLAWFDEPPPKKIWTAIWRGMTDRGGAMYLTGTPLASPWVYDEYRKLKDNQDPVKWYIQFHSEVNAKNLGEGDAELGKQRLKEFADSLDPEERAARLEGAFVQLQGLIFKSWSRATHVIAPFDIPTSWRIIESVDPHPQKPWAVTWTALAPNGAKILLQSLYLEGTIDDIGTGILMGRAKLPVKEGLRPNITRTLIDNSASVPTWQKSNIDPTARRISVREELELMIGPRGAGGPRVEVAPKNVQGKIDLFKRWLNMKPRNGVTRADFYAFDTPENDSFFREIEMYAWAKFQSKARADEAKGQPVKKNDDLIDTVLQVALTLGNESGAGDSGIVDMTGGFTGYGEAGLLRGGDLSGRRNFETRSNAQSFDD